MSTDAPVAAEQPAKVVEPQADATTSAVEVKTATNGSTASALKGLTDAEIDRKIVGQISFYLGDANLPYDQHLFEEAQSTLDAKQKLEEPGTGWIKLDHVASFKRMRVYQTLEDGRVIKALRAAIAAAPETEKHLLELSEDGKQIRRTRKIAPETAMGQLDRSIYAKGFGEEVDGLQERLELFFDKYGAINAVRMRRDNKNGPRAAAKPFKGSVFVEFGTPAEAEAFVKLSPAPTFDEKLGALEVMSKRAYIDKKAEEHKSEPKYGSAPQNRPFSAFRQLKDLKSGKGKAPASKETKEKDLHLLHEGKNYEITADGKLAKPDEFEFKPDRLLQFTGLAGGEAPAPVNDIKRKIYEVHAPSWIEISDDRKGGLVSFRENLIDERITQLNDKKIQPEGNTEPLVFSRVEDKDAERSFYYRRLEFRIKDYLSNDGTNERSDRGRRNDSDRGSRGRGGRGGRGGNRGGRGRDRDRNAEQRSGRNGDRMPQIVSVGGGGSKRQKNSENSEAKAAPKREREEGGDRETAPKKAKVDAE